MKTIPVSLLAAGFLWPTACLAESKFIPEKPVLENQTARRAPRKPFTEVWKETDVDANGSISAEEFAALPRIQKLPKGKHEPIFKRLDKDADGKLNHAELSDLGKRKPSFPIKRLWELDADKNEKISLEEFQSGSISKKLPPEKLITVFKKLDTDGDGVITKNDRPVLRQRTKPKLPNDPR